MGTVQMKITRVEPIIVALPYEHAAPKPLMGTGQPRTTMDALYIRVDTDQGLSGWGEAYGFAACRATATIVSGILAPLAIGRDAADIPALMDDFHRRFQSLGRNGPAGFALSGFDIALWDIAGKVAGQPIHRLLGGTGKTHITAYASLLRTGGALEHVRRLTADALDRGYTHIKLHDRTVEAVAAARSIVGPDFPLMLDTNCAWTLEGAIDMTRRFEPYGLQWIEEPIYPADDFDAMARLRRTTRIPIAAGENLGNLNDVRHIVEAGAVDIVQPDVIKIGGITETWKALALTHEHGIRGDPHSPYYGPGLIASLHLIAAMSEEIWSEFFFADLEASPLGEVIYPVGGRFTVPQGPGLGIDVDERILERYRVG
jgi:L-alanine-DL-glutamate epimerase-like enolase superfamily enzyme